MGKWWNALIYKNTSFYWYRVLIICTTEEVKSMQTINSMDNCFTQWFQWKVTINLDVGTQIDLILMCLLNSEAAAKKAQRPLFQLIISAGAQNESARQKGKAFLRMRRQPYRLMQCDVIPAGNMKSHDYQVHTSRRFFFSEWKKKKKNMDGDGDRSCSDGKMSTILQGVIHLVLDLLWSPF